MDKIELYYHLIMFLGWMILVEKNMRIYCLSVENYRQNLESIGLSI
jgi:hypothetical protein